MKITILVLIEFIFFITLLECVGRIIFGRFLYNKEVLPFLEKHLQEYRLNKTSWQDGKKCLFNMTLPYIAATPLNLFTRWYIQDYGRIPKWSKADKMITDYFNALPKPPKRSLLKDL